MFTKDFKELLSAFNAHQVKYLIVGGYAVAIHAQPRATKDFDILCNRSQKTARPFLQPWQNSERLWAA